MVQVKVRGSRVVVWFWVVCDSRGQDLGPYCN